MQEVQPTDRIEEPDDSAGTIGEETQEASPVSEGASSKKDSKGKRAAPSRERPRLLTRYRSELSSQMAQEFSYGNSMEIPAVKKVVINVGLGEALTNARAMETTIRDIGMITGQRPVSTKARRSVATFKVREGQAIGAVSYTHLTLPTKA